MRTFHHSIEHLRERGAPGDRHLDPGEPLEKCLALLQHGHEAHVFLHAQLALGAQGALLFEHAQRAQSHGQASCHGAQQPDLGSVEPVAPRTGEDEMATDFFDGNADGRQVAHSREPDQVRAVSSGRKQRTDRHAAARETDHFDNSIGGHHGGHFSLERFGRPLDGTEHRCRRVRAGSDGHKKFGELLRGPVARGKGHGGLVRPIS